MIDPITKDKSKIYKKIELIVKETGENLGRVGEIKVSHENSAMLISGNFMIIITLEGGHQKGEIYKLDNVKSYRTNLEKL
jgi:hypothetical protein|tara:strand:- start:1906 stop:2145 length:240 start_codon:yes stop_codon:yes gene_type:complete